MTLTEARKRFLSHCGSAANLSPHTMRAYGSDLDHTQKFFGVRKHLSAVERNHLRQYIHYMRETKRFKETTIKRRLASLKLLFKWAAQEEVVTVNPFDSLHERIRLPKRLPRALDRADQAALRRVVTATPRVDGFERIRDKLAVQLMLDTGIRVGELISINLADVSLASQWIVIHGKGNRQRLVYLLRRSLVRSIEQYLTWRDSLLISTERLFVSLEGHAVSAPQVRVGLRKIAKEAGISRRVTPHMLRHTCATQWLEDGLDIRHVQKLLGHHSISTTEIYTHVSDQGLREALSRAAGGRKR